MSEAEPQAEEPQEPRLRRGLLGYRAKDVEAELAARRDEIEELRADVAALWLAFGQHERTIRHLIAAMEALEGAAPSPAPETPSPTPQPAAGQDPPVPADVIGAQLDDLGGVLEAIEKATRSLERAYADEVAPTEPDAEPGADARAAEGGEGASDPRPEPS